jgi:hypothetical protein
MRMETTVVYIYLGLTDVKLGLTVTSIRLHISTALR